MTALRIRGSTAHDLVHVADAHPSTARLLLDRRHSRGSRRSGNKLLLGDNLAVLRLLTFELRGRIRCIYLDPPYNNRERYSHYDDLMSHDEWLIAMTDRLQALWPLLREDGSLWISIDDGEAHYLKVAADAAFGREAFITSVVWEQRTTRENRRSFSVNHEYILVFSRDPALFRTSRGLLPPTEAMTRRYRNPDSDPRGPWQSVSLNVQAGHGTPSQFYELVTPSGARHRPPPGRCWMFTKERMLKEIDHKNIWFGRNGTAVPRLKHFLATGHRGLNPDTLWRASDVGTTDSAKKRLLELFPAAPPFDTPKPEALIERVIHIASEPDDIVLDAYLGSGTTAVVANRMGRRFIGIENSTAIMDLARRRIARDVRETKESGSATQSLAYDFYKLQI